MSYFESCNNNITIEGQSHINIPDKVILSATETRIAGDKLKIRPDVSDSRGVSMVRRAGPRSLQQNR
jgi:hypothetical protein